MIPEKAELQNALVPSEMPLDCPAGVTYVPWIVSIITLSAIQPPPEGIAALFLISIFIERI